MFLSKAILCGPIRPRTTSRISARNTIDTEQSVNKLRVLCITILTSERRGIGSNNSIPIFTRNTTVDVGGASSTYELHDDFSAELGGCSTVNIRILDAFGLYRRVDLPKAMRRRILGYLKEGPPGQPFDCNSLIHFLYGFGYRFGTFNDSKCEWKCTDLLAGTVVNSGQSLLMLKNDRLGNPTILKHVALCLGEGLYLSKSGKEGVLMVTDFANLKKLYSPRKSYVIEKI